MIRCTVMFEEKQEKDGKVQFPVVFTVNGSRVIPEGVQTFIECTPGKPLYPYSCFTKPNSFLAKVKIY